MQHTAGAFGVRALVELVAAGQIALPEFQREFVWDPNRVIDLLDSICNGWPIGSLLILEGPQPFEVKPIEGGPPVDAAEVRFYLLDGQQRVTALYHALTDASDVVYFVDLNDATTEDGLPPFKWSHRHRRWRTSEFVFTIREMFDGAFFYERVAGLGPREAERALAVRESRLGQLLRDYTVPATIMAQDIELEALTRIFETLNRAGVPLDAFDLMVAVLYPVHFDLRRAWDEARVAHPSFASMDVSGLEPLKLIALWQRDEDSAGNPRRVPASRRVTGVRQKDVLNIPADTVKRRWEDSCRSYAGALAFVADRIGIEHPGGLPSQAMVLTLAYLMHEGVPEDDLARWFWRSVAMQSYAQGANTQVLQDIDRWPESLADVPAALDAARAGLRDLARRNRVLRLGLRALVAQRSGLDPHTGLQLKGPMAEVPLTSLVRGEVRAVGDSSVLDLVVMREDAVRPLRLALRRVAPTETLATSALVSQGFAPSLWVEPIASTRAQREDVVLGWLKEIL